MVMMRLLSVKMAPKPFTTARVGTGWVMPHAKNCWASSSFQGGLPSSVSLMLPAPARPSVRE
jgi:hypothetical protein